MHLRPAPTRAKISSMPICSESGLLAESSENFCCTIALEKLTMKGLESEVITWFGLSTKVELQKAFSWKSNHSWFFYSCGGHIFSEVRTKTSTTAFLTSWSWRWRFLFWVSPDECRMLGSDYMTLTLWLWALKYVNILLNCLSPRFSKDLRVSKYCK